MEVVKQYRGRSMAQETLRRLIKNRGAIIGACFLLFLIIVAILSQFIFDYDTQIIGALGAAISAYARAKKKLAKAGK